jgi:hypothetical protein
MTRNTRNTEPEVESNELRLDRLLGRRVLGRNNQAVGRLEEFRAERHGTGAAVAEYVIGRAGLVERLGGSVRLLIGRYQARGYVARWNQIDISDPDRPRLLCGLDELREL